MSKHEISWVSNDDELAMKLASDYLIEKGCRDILLLPGCLASQQESERIRGYRTSLAEHGIEFDSRKVLSRSGKESSETETEQLIRDYLGKGNHADAVIASSDRAAFGALTALEQVGCYVPEDIRLMCFDNSPYTAMAAPGITALDRRPDRIAYEAVGVMMCLLKKTETNTQRVIPITLVERTSTR